MNISTALSVKIAAILAATFLVAGCNTVKGLGEDIESVGRAGEEAID
ncbi:entericidin A/B family lipoprotein [Sphingorhabdus sp. Alg239-R122]|nr:entericidin A/B family lipoprotein [Sphingorhabdus sp. Alg239-R122]